MDKAVLGAMEPYFWDKFYNPSATYLSARAVKEEIAELKKIVAGQLGAKHSEIIHTSGGTESNNLAVSGVMDRFINKKILVSAVEHESVLNPAKKYTHEIIKVDEQGVVRLDLLEKMIDDETVLISVMLVNNETGTIQPVKKIAEIIRRIRLSRQKRGLQLPLLLHTDACQAPCYLDVHTSRLGVDMMTLNGGKIYGPKGSGVLFVKAGAELSPQILGGGQQRNLRSGTENPAALAGFAKAFGISVEKRKDETERIERLRQEFIDGLMDMSQDITINGDPKRQSPHIVSVTFPQMDNERILFALDDAGILAASGSACSASSEEPSHVLGAMGLGGKTARATLRFSFGRQTRQDDIRKTLQVLKTLF